MMLYKLAQILPVIEEEEMANITPNNLGLTYNSDCKVFHSSYFDGIEERYWKINNKLNGPYVSLYLNNKPKIICNYIDGVLHGEYCEYNKYGELIKQCNYLNGVLHGPYREFHPFFKTKYIECFYVNGKLHGLYTKYDDNYNTKYYECSYSNGKKNFNPIRMFLNSLNSLFVRNLIDLDIQKD